MKTTTPTAQIALDTSVVANECDTTPISVLRAYAFGTLKGSRLPTGKHKFLPADVQSFIAAGTPGLATPPDTHKGTQSHGAGWFENKTDEYFATLTLSAVRAAMEKLVPSDEKLLAMVNAQGTTSLSGTAQATPEILALLGKPVPQSVARKNPSPFQDMRSLILGHALRDSARRVMAKSSAWLNAPLAALYGGFEIRSGDGWRVMTFADTIAAATPDVLRNGIEIVAYRSLAAARGKDPDNLNAYTRNWTLPQTVSVTIRLPFGAITSAAELSGPITAAAF